MKSGKQTLRPAVLALCLIFNNSAAAAADPPPDFSGIWQQDLSRSTPPRKTAHARQLKIEQHGSQLAVKISQGTRSLDLQYEIGGPEVSYTGLDGDEFHAKVAWNGSSLVFKTLEHERGREIPSATTWTLAEAGSILRQVKQSGEHGKESESIDVFVKR